MRYAGAFLLAVMASTAVLGQCEFDTIPAAATAGRMDVDGEWAIVGDRAFNSADGIAYIYRRVDREYQLFQTFPAPVVGSFIGFGESVGISGNFAFIGAGGLGSGPIRGGVFVYEFDGAAWNLLQTLTQTGAVENSAFGRNSLDVQGGVLAIGDRGKGEFKTISEQRGMVQVFEYDGASWVLNSELDGPPFVDRISGFGLHGLTIDGDRLAVGLGFLRAAEDRIGAVFVYKRSGGVWAFEQSIFTPEPNINDDGQGSSFGSFYGGLRLNGDRLYVGAPAWDAELGLTIRRQHGKMYVFERGATSWELHSSFTASPPVAGDGFGRAIAVTPDNELLVGRVASGTVQRMLFNDSDWVTTAVFSSSGPSQFLGGFVQLAQSTFASKSRFAVELFDLDATTVEITGSPQGCLGDPLELTALTDLPNATFQWYVDGAPIQNATSGVYSISDPSEGDAGMYEVEARSCQYTTFSEPVEVTVLAGPTIESGPLSEVACSGDTVTFSVSVAPGGSETYQWTLDGGAIPGATGSTLVLSNVSETDAGSYRCLVTEICTVESPVATLTVVDGTDTDGDGLCDALDPDADNDGVEDGLDPAALDPFICGDSDGDSCDDCAVGRDGFGPLPDGDPANDGPDADGDGLCDLGDADADNDGVPDDSDSAPLDPFICQDSDEDGCDDCSGGSFDPSNDGVDTDSDGLCDAGDPDDDNDGVADVDDTDRLDRFACRDVDEDGCDDCSSGADAPNDDGLDTDSDGLCDAGDDDDDNDGCDDAEDPQPLVASDDTDSDGLGNDCDTDDDNDGVADIDDAQPLNRNVCRDVDSDGCDDCSSGTDAPGNDGVDTDGDGLCDAGDTDDDNDGVADSADAQPLNRNVCRDVDSDGCDDCSSGADAPGNDGLDTDSDGLCDAGDADDDNDGCDDAVDPQPLAASADTDSDGLGNDCDADDDNDGVADVDDAEPLNQLACRDTDGDGCDDCSSGADAPDNDGLDTDADGLCDAGDADDDNDGCDDAADPQPFVASDDTDSDGLGNDCDADDDNDGVADSADAEPLNPNVCRDVDGDSCDDCSSGTDAPGNDGLDTDGDGLCDAGDDDDDNDGCVDGSDDRPLVASVDTDSDGLADDCDADDDNDAVADVDDAEPLNELACRDADGDGCDDCSSGSDAPGNDGLDTDGDGLCDAGDPDDDNDMVEDADDPAPLDPTVCGDADENGCDDCSDVVCAPSFRRGDANADLIFDISDGITVLQNLFLGLESLRCLDAGDANDDGTLDLSDSVFIFSSLFIDSRPIPAPGTEECGQDPTKDAAAVDGDLGCEAFEPCE